MEREKKKLGRPRKGKTVRDTMVTVVMNDEEMERFDEVARALGKSRSDVMRAALQAARKERGRRPDLQRTHQIGLRLDAEELAALDRLLGRLNTSRGGVLKHGIDLLYQQLQEQQEPRQPAPSAPVFPARRVRKTSLLPSIETELPNLPTI